VTRQLGKSSNCVPRATTSEVKESGPKEHGPQAEVRRKHMTRKDAIKAEKDLKARGVYKPYVSQDGDSFIFESYPLEARIKGVFDSERGPMMNVTVKDVSQNYAVVATINLDFGQHTVQHVAPLLVSLHPEAFARAKAKEHEALPHRVDPQGNRAAR
jgi:hypothetical protein